MLRPLVLVAAFGSLCGALQAQQPAVKHKMVTADHQNVTATITYEIKTTKFAANRWLVYLAEPPELPGQTKVKVSSVPEGKVVAEKSPLARDVRFFDVAVAEPVAGGSVTFKQTVQATVRTRKLVPLGAGERAPKVDPLTDKELAYYTAAGPTLNFEDKEFQGWLDKKGLRAKKGEQPVAFAARVLTVIRADYKYNGAGDQDQHAAAVCQRATGDCAGMTSLFVAALRANKVPARALVGRFTKPRKAGEDSTHPHVRAEMFVAGVGWVPVDATYANGNKNRPVESYIGEDVGDMIVLHVDVDLRLQFLNKETVAGYIQVAPYYHAFGKGEFDARFGPSGWDLKAVPVKK